MGNEDQDVIRVVSLVTNARAGERKPRRGVLTTAGGNYCIADKNNNGSSGIELNNRAESGTNPPLTGAVVNNIITGNGAQQFAFAGTGILGQCRPDPGKRPFEEPALRHRHLPITANNNGHGRRRPAPALG